MGAMGMNIKNQRVHDLAREAAGRSGLTQTSVIEQALTLYLADHTAATDPEGRTARVHAILDDLDRRLTDEHRALLLADDLYDDAGLPA